MTLLAAMTAYVVMAMNWKIPITFAKMLMNATPQHMAVNTGAKTPMAPITVCAKTDIDSSRMDSTVLILMNVGQETRCVQLRTVVTTP